MSTIAEEVKAIIVDKLGVEPSEVTDSANFTNDLGADSLDSVDLIMALENKFDLEPDDEAEGKIATVAEESSREIRQIILRKRNSKNGRSI